MNNLLLKTLIVLAFIIAGESMNAQKISDDPVLMIINGEKITKNEFLNVYRKNNVNSQVLDKKSLDEYLNLYVNFKLKVCEAKELGLDTAKAFKTELKGYRDQLAQPYLTDKEVTEELVKEAYDRMHYDLRASHILIKMKADASPADTLTAFNKAMKLRERIIKGEDFGRIAQEESDDPSAKDNAEKKYTGNKGDLGYFTVFDMTYPFESAAYRLKPGEISMPVRTDYGYHIIKLTDKKPAMGKVQVAHIYVSVPKTVISKDSLKIYRDKIEEAYKKLKEGGSFEELAKEYSDDKGSSTKGGLLPAFVVNRIVPEFIIAIDKLKEKGEISEPVHTSYGWHIIKLVEKKGIGTFDEKKAEIKSKISKDTRSEKSKDSFIARVKKENHFNEDIKALKEFYKVVTDSVFEGKWKAEQAKDLKKSLFRIGDTSFTQQSFAKYISTRQGMREKESIESFVDGTYREFINEAVTNYEDRNLEKKYLDFRLLTQEYRDGILLFDLTDKKVWSKAVKDTSGLEKFYQENKNKYMWGERLNATIYTCIDEKTEKEVRKMMKKIGKKGFTEKDMLEKINKESKEGKENLKIETNFFSKGDNAIIDSIAWKPGITEKFKKSGSYIFVNVIKTVPPEPKSLKEARGLVTADYQSFLEQDWIASLKNKYRVEINNDVLNSIK